MEITLKADDLRRADAALVGVLAGDLNRALDRLRAGVGEEGPSGETRFAQSPGKAHHRLAVEEVGNMDQATGLLPDGLDHGRIAVPN